MAVAEQTPDLAVAKPVTTGRTAPRKNVDRRRLGRQHVRQVFERGKSSEALPDRRGSARGYGRCERRRRGRRRAFPTWSKVAPRDRGRVLLRIAEELETHSDELARTIALETG